MFRTLIYPLSRACDYSVELPHWSYCTWFDVCWSFGVVGLEWYPCCSQHVSNINIYIIRSFRLFCWIPTLVVLFLVRCVLECRCGWVGVVFVLQAEAQVVLHIYETTWRHIPKIINIQFCTTSWPHKNVRYHRKITTKYNIKKVLLITKATCFGVLYEHICYLITATGHT